MELRILCNKISKIMLSLGSEKIFKAGFLLSLANIFGGALGYLYQIVMGNLMSPSDYAVFSASMALVTFFLSPVGAFTMSISRKVSMLCAKKNIESLNSFYKTINLFLLGTSILIVLIGIFESNRINLYLKSDSQASGLYVIFILVSTIFVANNMAFFQGLQKFMLLSIFGLLGIIFKTIGSSSFLVLGFGLNGALFGILLSSLTIYLIGYINLRRALPRLSYFSFRGFYISWNSVKSVAPIVMANVGFVAMTQLDMFLVNLFFLPEIAGDYAVASILGKAILYLPGGLVLVMYPMVAENHALGKESASILFKVLCMTLFCCLFAAFFYWFSSGAIVQYLYGPAYVGAASILKWYGFAILPFALVMVAEQFFIAKGKIIFSWIFFLLFPLQILTIFYWHQEIWMVLFTMGAFGTLLAVIGFGLMASHFVPLKKMFKKFKKI